MRTRSSSLAVTVVVTALLVASGSGCAALRSVAREAAKEALSNDASSSSTKKTPREIAACKKMCEVAGDAEQHADQIAACQKKCE